MTSKRSAALSELVHELNLQSRGIATDEKSGVTVHLWWWRQAQASLVTVDRGDNGWDIFVPASCENSVAATREALTAYCRQRRIECDKEASAQFAAAIGHAPTNIVRS